MLFYTLDCLPILLSFLPFIFMHPGYLLPDMPPKGSTVAPGVKPAEAAIEAAEAGEVGRSESLASAGQQKSPKDSASDAQQQQFKMVVLAEPAP